MSVASKISGLGKAALFVTEYFSDMLIYFRYCGISPFQDKRKKLFYKIIIETHAIEKGLSLRGSRPLFGKAKISFIMAAIRRYDKAYSLFPVQMGCGALRTYAQRHKDQGITDPILTQIDSFLSEIDPQGTMDNGGLRTFETLPPHIDTNPNLAFLTSRFSSRIYDATPLPPEDISALITAAQSCPSQCNRQSTHVYYYSDRAKIDELMALQGGSISFAHEVGNLLVIASDLAAWGGAQQRNQLYVDGALFSMNVMLAAHAMGLQTCPLNLAVTHKTEKAIKAAGNINPDQRLIMMISLGRSAGISPMIAARSPRRDVSEILHIA